jgi:hypothetical protein
VSEFLTFYIGVNPLNLDVYIVTSCVIFSTPNVESATFFPLWYRPVENTDTFEAFYSGQAKLHCLVMLLALCTAKGDFEGLLKAVFQSSHEAPRSSRRVRASN